jgi:hypothetical protein
MSVQVRTADGDVSWVKTAYVVDAEPGRRRAARLDAEIAELAASGSRIPSYWAAIVGVVCLIGGFVAGYFWLDRRVRRQFGGVRVY